MDIKKKRGIYWLVDNLTAEHRIKAMLLGKRGYECLFLSSLQTFKEQVQKQRVSIIIIDDGLGLEQTERAIQYLLANPEVQGARLILSSTEPNQAIFKTAACSAFRDIIPLKLDNRNWLIRFVFATASHKIDIPKPNFDIGIGQICSFSIPSRVVWISNDRMLLEGKCRPQSGTTLNLTGAFAQSLGLKSIPLVVQEHRHTDLVYRFSDATLVSWSIPAAARSRADDILGKMRQTDFGPKCKVFLAMQNVELRTSFARNLDPLRFEVNIALQKQSIINEPKFFCPHIVFFEDRLCLDDEFARFKQMLENIPVDIPVYIVGNRVQLKTAQAVAPGHKVGVIPSMPRRLTDMIFSKLLPTVNRRTPDVEEHAIHLSSDHPFSIAELQTAGRLLRLHPTSVQIASPVKLGMFGLLRVESPVFKKFIGDHSMVKIFHTMEDGNFEHGTNHYIADCFLATIDKKAQRKLATDLIKFLSDQYLARNDESTTETPHAPAASTQGHTKADPHPYQNTTGSVNTTAANVELPQAEAPTTPSLKDTLAKPEEVFKKTDILDTVITTTGDVFTEIKRILTSNNFRVAATFMSAVFATFLILWFVVNFIAPYWHKSGGVYTDSLKKFAPEKFNETQNNQQLEGH